MKTIITVFYLFFIAFIQNNHAASIIFKGYRFEVNVLTQKRGILREYCRGSRKFIKVQEGDEYSIIIKNPLPVRVAVAVSIDGLNIIDGKRTSPDKSSKWILDPWSSITLRGWQTGKKSLRRFIFTREKHSYARWKEKYDKKNYTKNLGVIGVAYFWDSRELYCTLNPPQPFSDKEASRSESQENVLKNRVKSFKKYRSSKRAGTGMGKHEYNPVKKVDFHYDTGMFNNRNVLRIYYEFGRYSVPEPFIDEDNGFAPDMYNYFGNFFIM